MVSGGGTDTPTGERKRRDRLQSKDKKKQSVSRRESSRDSETAPPPCPEPVEEMEVVGDISWPSPSHSHLSIDGAVALMDLELTNWNVTDGNDLSTLLSGPSVPLPDFLNGQTTTDDNFCLPALSVPSTTATFSPQFNSPQLSSPPSLGTSSAPSSTDMEFPDSYLLPVHELTILKAMLRISQRIGCDAQSLWKLDCLSPFNQGLGTPADQLPEAWRPTPSQVSVPHHPVIDFLPWPSTRDRILMFLELPDEARPPIAQGPLALVNFVYDLEDNAEGVRIYGADPCDPGGWEVGQVLFERWWFLFDRSIIETSNRWRELRGAAPLLLKAE